MSVKSSSNIIYYPAGCYGTFFEWLCSGHKETSTPLTSSGSSHSFLGHQLSPTECVEYFKSGHNYDFIRCHPSIFESFGSNEKVKNSSYYDVVVADLNFLSSVTNGNILVLYPTSNTMLWHFHNILDKLQATAAHLKGNKFFPEFSPQWNFITAPTEYKKLQETINSEVDASTIQHWGKDSVYELSPWELREILVFHWFSRNKDLYTCFDTIEGEFPHIKFLSLDQLQKNTEHSMNSVLAYFKINDLGSNVVKKIAREWRMVQYHIDKDRRCAAIVKNIINQNTEYSWHHIDMTFIDDVYIQKQLNDADLEVCGHGVDCLPKSTKKFLSLLRKKQK